MEENRAQDGKLREKQERKKDKKAKQANTPETPVAPKVRPIEAGDYVRIKGQTSVGQVMEISGRNAVVMFGLMKTNVKADRLERTDAPKALRYPARRPLSAAKPKTGCTKS